MNDTQSKIPRVTVKILFRCGNKILYQITNGKIRDISGGHVEFGETTLQALERELKEELDYSINQEAELLDVWTYLSPDGLAHRINIVYLINVSEEINFKHKEDGDRTEFIWLHKNDIKIQKFLPGMEACLLKAFK